MSGLLLPAGEGRSVSFGDMGARFLLEGADTGDGSIPVLVERHGLTTRRG